MQDLFDRAVTGAKQQGCLAKASGGGCFYRDPDNPAIRCAVGHLIPDALYRPNLEDVNAGSLLEENPHIAAALGVTFPGAVVDMLADLQVAHDFSKDVGGFLLAAKDVARNYGLNFDVCEEA